MKEKILLANGERPILIVIRENLQRYLDESGKTAYQASREAGFTNGEAITRILNGRGITVDILQRIANGLGLKTTDLIDDWEEL